MPSVLVMLIVELTIGAYSNVKRSALDVIEGIEVPTNIFRWLFKAP
jgi:hypothetical protein